MSDFAMKYALGKRRGKGTMAAGCDAHGAQDCEMCMAEGGEVDERNGPTPGGVHADVSRKEWGSGARRGTSVAGEHHRGAEMAKKAGQNKAHHARSERSKELHREALGKLQNDNTDRKNLAEGGMVDDDDDLVGRIMRKREPVADFEDNDFDEMDQRSAPDDADYTGENSGDELGNEELEAADAADDDLVARIMRSRNKKYRMPRPA